jgi:hypothetical protein
MLDERIAFKRLEEGTLSKQECEAWINFYMDMKEYLFENGHKKAFKEVRRKDRIMTTYFIEKFILNKGEAS